MERQCHFLPVSSRMWMGSRGTCDGLLRRRHCASGISVGEIRDDVENVETLTSVSGTAQLCHEMVQIRQMWRASHSTVNEKSGENARSHSPYTGTTARIVSLSE